MTSTVRTLIDADRLALRVRELGAKISADHAATDDLVLVCVLKGGFVFAADLVRAIEVPTSVEFVRARSYGNAEHSSGVVEIEDDLTRSIEGKNVLLVEDIVDTGLTTQVLLGRLSARRPKTLRVAALLHKPSRQRVAVEITYLGFTIEDVFVVGYGLDHAERYRSLPFVAVLGHPEPAVED